MNKNQITMDRIKLFKEAFMGMKNVTVNVSDSFGFFDASVYINGIEFIQTIGESGSYMVFINNPYCEVDESGCPIFTKEHPHQQLVFGYYKSLKLAINKAKAIVVNMEYPKPIEVW